MFSGVFTALVTPFQRDGAIDFERLALLIERQADAGVDGVVPVGTTGESPTLSHAEHCKVIEATVAAAAGRIRVIAGAGSNATSEAVDLTRHARDAGADATLQIAPYYNKPSQEGLYRHFSAVADVGLPVMLYNVPGRTGREIEVATVARLATHPMIRALKEAGGGPERVTAVLHVCEIDILSGDDPLTLPMMAVGAKGVVSVASNVAPKAVRDLVHAARLGRREEALALHRRWHPLFRDLFLDTNPIPVKAAMAMMGMIEESYRLPLCEMNGAQRERLRQTLISLELLSATEGL